MTPRDYLDQIARPSIEDFRHHPTSIRHAWTAAAALFHFRDWLAKDRGAEPSVVQAEFEVGFPQFRAIADIANASKHFKLDHSGPRKGLSTQHFRAGRGAAFSDGTYYSDGSTHSDAPDVIRMEFSGERIDVLNLCRQAFTFLQTKAP